MARTDQHLEHESTLRRWRNAGASAISALRAVGQLVRGTNAPATELEHPDVRFEPSDVTSRTLIITGFGILGFMWVCVVVLFWFYRAGEHWIPQASVPSPEVAVPQGTLPPQPRLQISPRADYQGELAYENQQLHKYSWVDKNKGTVTIPIEQAMEWIAQHGIPPQTAPAELKLYPPQAGSRDTGFEGKVAPEPR
jgi:hypothetical protein